MKKHRQITAGILLSVALLAQNCKSENEKYYAYLATAKAAVEANDVAKFGKTVKSLTKAVPSFLPYLYREFAPGFLAANRVEYLKSMMENSGQPMFPLIQFVQDRRQFDLVTQLGAKYEDGAAAGINALYHASRIKDKGLLESLYKATPSLYTRFDAMREKSAEYQIAGDPESVGFKLFYGKKLISRDALILNANSAACENTPAFAPYIGFSLLDSDGYPYFRSCAETNIEARSKYSKATLVKLAKVIDKDGQNMLLSYLLRQTENPDAGLDVAHATAIAGATDDFLLRGKDGLGVLELAAKLCPVPDHHGEHADVDMSDETQVTKCQVAEVVRKAYNEALEGIYNQALLAVSKGDITAIDRLKAQKIALDDVRATNGQTLLMEAIIYDQKAIVEKLLQERVNATVTRNDGKKAADLALASGNAEIQALLQKFGAL